MPLPASAASTGSRRRISSDAGTGVAVTLLAAAPSSMILAPVAASRRACAIAAEGSRKRPPSENESAVMLTIPTRSGLARSGGCIPAISVLVSNGAGAFEDRADRFGVGEDVQLFD